MRSVSEHPRFGAACRIPHSFFDIPTVVRAIKLGAEDFLIKPVSSDQLLQAVGRAIAHHDATRSLNAVRSRIATLTPREREVFELVIRGQTNKHAARSLGCAERTIKAHRHRVMEKMQVESLAELVSLAERIGVMSRKDIQPGPALTISSASIVQACSPVEQLHPASHGP